MREDEARDLHLDLVTCDSCPTSCSLSLGVAEPWSAPQPGNWPFTPVSLPWGSMARGARQDPGGELRPEQQSPGTAGTWPQTKAASS